MAFIEIQTNDNSSSLPTLEQWVDSQKRIKFPVYHPVTVIVAKPAGFRLETEYYSCYVSRKFYSLSKILEVYCEQVANFSESMLAIMVKKDRKNGYQQFGLAKDDAVKVTGKDTQEFLDDGTHVLNLKTTA